MTQVLLLGVFLAAVVFAIGYCIHMPGQSYRGPLAPLSAQEQVVGEAIASHIGMLAGTIGERNYWRYEALQAAADYIERQFLEMGYEVRPQTYEIDGRPFRNLEVELPGRARPDEIVVVGAHYDSVRGSPGANDNASGVAALLELARLLRSKTLDRSLRLVAFVNEEPPFYRSELMGSQAYVRDIQAKGERIAAMLSLETIGFYSEAPGSQRYPFPINFFYPDRGDFIAFVANLGSGRLVRKVVSDFRRHTDFPSEGIAAPGMIPGVDWSDQWAFWAAGYPAVMVTDTALYRYPYYHSAADRPERVDYGRTARVVAGLARVVEGLAVQL